jgi:cytochrome P450 family 9
MLILELKDIYTRCTTDVIATTAFGLKVDSLQQPTNKFYVMGQEATNFGMMKWFLVLTLPKIMKVSQHTVVVNSYHVQLNNFKP